MWVFNVNFKFTVINCVTNLIRYSGTCLIGTLSNQGNQRIGDQISGKGIFFNFVPKLGWVFCWSKGLYGGLVHFYNYRKFKPMTVSNTKKQSGRDNPKKVIFFFFSSKCLDERTIKLQKIEPWPICSALNQGGGCFDIS